MDAVVTVCRLTSVILARARVAGGKDLGDAEGECPGAGPCTLCPEREAPATTGAITSQTRARPAPAGAQDGSLGEPAKALSAAWSGCQRWPCPAPRGSPAVGMPARVYTLRAPVCLGRPGAGRLFLGCFLEHRGIWARPGEETRSPRLPPCVPAKASSSVMPGPPHTPGVTHILLGPPEPPGPRQGTRRGSPSQAAAEPGAPPRGCLPNSPWPRAVCP